MKFIKAQDKTELVFPCPISDCCGSIAVRNQDDLSGCNRGLGFCLIPTKELAPLIDEENYYRFEKVQLDDFTLIIKEYDSD